MSISEDHQGACPDFSVFDIDLSDQLVMSSMFATASLLPDSPVSLHTQVICSAFGPSVLHQASPLSLNM